MSSLINLKSLACALMMRMHGCSKHARPVHAPRRRLPAAAAALTPCACCARAQMVVTSCWLTLKEVALLLGALARHAPPSPDAAPGSSFFDAAQLGGVGERLMHLMGVIKHNGAVEKAQTGYIALAQRCAMASSSSGILHLLRCSACPTVSLRAWLVQPQALLHEFAD